MEDQQPRAEAAAGRRHARPLSAPPDGPVTSAWHVKHTTLLGFYRYAIGRGHVAEAPLPTVLPKRPPAFVLDEALHVRLWSSECEDLWGLRHGDVRGRSLRDIQFGLPVRPIEALVRSVLEDGERTEAVLDASDRDGVPFPCRVVASPLSPLGVDGDGVLVLVRREPVVG